MHVSILYEILINRSPRSPSVPDLDSPVARGGDNVLLVEVDDVDGRAVADQHAAQVDLGRGNLKSGLKSGKTGKISLFNCFVRIQLTMSQTAMDLSLEQVTIMPL